MSVPPEMPPLTPERRYVLSKYSALLGLPLTLGEIYRSWECSAAGIDGGSGAFRLESVSCLTFDPFSLGPVILAVSLIGLGYYRNS